MGFIVETPPVLLHKCKLPKTWFEDENKLAQPSYAHLTIWQCDECNKYWLYHDFKREMYYPFICYPFTNGWSPISHKKAMKLKYKWEK